MTKVNDNFRCDICGSFISENDLNNGSGATIRLKSEDNILSIFIFDLFGKKEWETICIKCNKENK